jgi:hypothetical protein
MKTLPQPLFALTLTDDELRAIGLVTVHWAILETQIDNFLVTLLTSPGTKNAFDQVNLLVSFDARMRLWRDAQAIVYAKRPQLLSDSESLRKKMLSARGKRDQLIHGLPHRSSPGNYELEYTAIRFKHTIQQRTLNVTKARWNAEKIDIFATQITEARKALAELLFVTVKNMRQLGA